MKKLTSIFITLLAFVMLCPAAGFTATEEFPFVSPLIAGQDIPVGEVRVWNDDMNVYVKYVITNSDWCLTDTHLAVEENLADIPQAKGNPIPGQFAYKDSMDCAPEQMYTIPLSWDPGTQVYIAAHAVVETICGYEDPDLALFAGMLPAEATMTASVPYLGGPAYFPEIDVVDDMLTGTYEGWCVSTALNLTTGVLYNANVFSSYAMLPDGLVDYPENLALINWILNQQFVGKPTECNPDLPVYTYGSVQRAIWSLIDDENSAQSLGPYSLCQVAEILDGAYANGSFYEPGCNEFVGVILQPFNSQGLPAQPVIIPVPLPCDPIFCDETAWGDGAMFPGKNWALYFTYSIDDAIEAPADIFQGTDEDQIQIKVKKQKKVKVKKNPRGIELP